METLSSTIRTQQESLGKDVKTHNFSCENCGAQQHFSPQKEALHCLHCGAVRTIKSDALAHEHSPFLEFDYREALQEEGVHEAHETIHEFTCKNCGAHCQFDGTATAQSCPYCASSHTNALLTRYIKPRGVIAFEISQDEIKATIEDWLKQLWFAPNRLTTLAKTDRAMTGLYMPYWTYDAQTYTRYSGQRGTYYYRNRMINGEKRIARDIEWWNVTGDVNRFFDDIAVPASKTLPQRLLTRINLWDFTKMKPYKPEFLAGFLSEAYTVTLEEGFKNAFKIIENQVKTDIQFDIGGDRQIIDDMSIKIGALTYKHILLPVWVASYHFNKIPYFVVINGQTGAIAGERPYSWMKVTLLSFGVVSAILSALYFIY